jgi:hypothetical protein
MPQKAHVTAIDALVDFRARLLVYVTKARPTLEEVSADVLRLRSWLEGPQRTHWENELRKRTRRLEEAQQARFSSKLSNLRKESAAEINAVHRARRALDEAEHKLRVIKQWNREFDSRVDPLVKQMEKMHTILANDLIQAAAYLDQAVKTLDSYAGVGAPVAAGPAPAPAEAKDQPSSVEAIPSEKGAAK